jgi:hypothetical protein
MTHLPPITAELVRQVWDGMSNPSTRRVAQKFRQAGRPVSHETVRRWRANGWRPLAREQHPLDAARVALDDAIPILTFDPLTTTANFVSASKDGSAVEELSDAELVRKASRELAIATIVVAQALMREPDIAARRPREVSILARSLAKCAQAVGIGFTQVSAMQESTAAERVVSSAEGGGQ